MRITIGPHCLLYLLMAFSCTSSLQTAPIDPSGFSHQTVEPMNIVSVIDINSGTLALIKTHSIIESAKDKHLLYFRFLVFGENLLLSHQSAFIKLFPNIQVEYKLLSEPAIFSRFSNTKYERSSVFGRLLIPSAFPDMDRFLYLDNDIVVNADVAELYSFPLYNRQTRSFVSSGFTVEHSQHHAKWIRTHFNLTHPLYLLAVESQRSNMRFLNSGVWLCNATLWRSLDLTSKAINIIERSFTEFIYHRNITSDQEVFYLLLHKDDVADLPLRFNMGIHSYNKFVDLSLMKTGFIHFSALDKRNICTRPLSSQPPAAHHALAFFLTVSRSLKKLYATNMSGRYVPLMLTDCDKLLDGVLESYRSGANASSSAQSSNDIGRFDPGRGQFSFPPANTSTLSLSLQASRSK